MGSSIKLFLWSVKRAVLAYVALFRGFQKLFVGSLI